MGEKIKYRFQNFVLYFWIEPVWSVNWKFENMDECPTFQKFLSGKICTFIGFAQNYPVSTFSLIVHHLRVLRMTTFHSQHITNISRIFNSGIFFQNSPVSGYDYSIQFWIPAFLFFKKLDSEFRSVQKQFLKRYNILS